MSQHASGHAHNHVLPLKTYLSVFAFLIVMTGVTVFVALFDLGELNIVVAMIVATAKAIAVAAIFMHLKYDNKLYMLAFLVSVLCLAIFITLTLIDTEYRGKIDNAVAHPIVPQVVLPNSGQPAHSHDEEGAEHPAATDSTAAHSDAKVDTAAAAHETAKESGH